MTTEPTVSADCRSLANLYFLLAKSIMWVRIPRHRVFLFSGAVTHGHCEEILTVHQVNRGYTYFCVATNIEDFLTPHG